MRPGSDADPGTFLAFALVAVLSMRAPTSAILGRHRECARGNPSIDRKQMAADRRIDQVGVGERQQMAGAGNVLQPRAGQHRGKAFGDPARDLRASPAPSCRASGRPASHRLRACRSPWRSLRSLQGPGQGSRSATHAAARWCASMPWGQPRNRRSAPCRVRSRLRRRSDRSYRRAHRSRRAARGPRRRLAAAGGRPPARSR